MGRRLTIEEKIKMINEKTNVIYVKGSIRNCDSKFEVKCECGEVFITSLRILKNANWKSYCKKCINENLRNKFKTNFNEVIEYFKNNGCVLLSKESDFKNMHSKLTYIARCGHKFTSEYNVFKKSKYKMCKQCKNKQYSGENVYNWKGGIYNSELEKFRKTYEFKHWHNEVFKRDKYTCRCCGNNKSGKLNSHHLDGYNWCIEGRTDINNGITLCEDCHKEFHQKYGYGDNTKEQFEKFLINKINNKEIPKRKLYIYYMNNNI